MGSRVYLAEFLLLTAASLAGAVTYGFWWSWLSAGAGAVLALWATVACLRERGR